MDMVATPTRRQQFVEMMHHRAMHQVNECLNVCLLSPRSEDKWTCVVRNKQHLELYAKKSNTTQSIFFLGMNEIHCGFDEVYRLLNYQTTTQFRLVMQLLYGRNFRDGALLSSHAPRDYDDAYDVAAVQHSALWFTLQATRESLVGKDNSLAFFQALMVLHPDRSNASTMLSTALNGGSSSNAAQSEAGAAPTFARPSDTVQKRTLALAWLPFHRADDDTQQQESMRLKYTLIVEEVARARLKLSCVVMSFRDGDDLHQMRSTSAARTIAKRLVNRSLTRLETAIIAARISRQTIVLPHQWVKNEDRVKCVICWKPFHSLLRRRHHCRLCGEVICGSCCSLRSTNVFRQDNKRLEKVRVCHMCSNRGVGGGIARPPRHSQSFGSRSSDHGTATIVHAPPSTMDIFAIHSNSRHVPMLERGRNGQEEDSDDDDGYAIVGQDTCDSNTSGTGYFGYIGTMMGLATTTTTSVTSDKLISIRSMTRAELIARSNTSASSNASSAHRATPHRRRSPLPLARKTPKGLVVRVATPSRRPPPPLPPQPTPPRNASQSPPSNDPFSRSYLHPSVIVPERVDSLNGPMSIVADVGSNDRMSMIANIASHERPSFRLYPGQNASNSTNPSTGKTDDSSSSARFDPLRRTSMMSLAMLDGYSASESDAKVPSGGTMAGALMTTTTTTTTAPRLDAAIENQRLKLMQLICSPACTLVDRVLMRACCERAAFDCGVVGAFIARVEETHVVLEHVVGTANLSAIDHFLRADTPCDYVLCTPPTDRPFCISDCTNDERTCGMVMVKDVRMRFFAGVSILVRELPIACLCVFSEGADDEEAVRLSRLSTSQYDFHVLEAAGQRISMELERLVHGVDIA